ncbi:MAG: RlmE family RNA methyltransferase [Spirochaetaceae bacterium]
MKRGKAPDHYTQRAKREGYPARSVYKLEEIHRKQPLFRPGDTVLDIGAAPGSWSLYLSRNLGPEGRVVAVDLKPLGLEATPENLTILTGDIYDEATQGGIAAAGPFDAVVSDAAPGTTGNRSVDTSRSAGLVEFFIEMLPAWLRPGGAFVAKLFQGGEERALLEECRHRFASAKMFKPRACRTDSFETFLVAADYRRQR